MSIQTGLRNQHLWRTARNSLYELGDLVQLLGATSGRGANTRRCSVLTKRFAQDVRPLASSPSRLSESDRGGHHVSPGSDIVSKSSLGCFYTPVVAVFPPLTNVVDQRLFDRSIDGEDVVVATEWGLSRFGEDVDTNDGEFARLDASSAFHHRRHEAALQQLDIFECATQGKDFLQFGPRGVSKLLRLRFDDVRTREEVSILKKVGLVGEHLLHPQRPLLIPRTGKSEGFVPRRQLDAPCSSILGQGDGEHFEHDALHVVFRL